VVEYYIWVCNLPEQGAPPPLEETILIDRAQRNRGAKIVRRFAKKQRLHQEVKRLDTVLVSHVPRVVGTACPSEAPPFVVLVRWEPS